MTQAKEGSSVKVHYKGTLSDGTIFDSSTGCDPLAFTIGEDQVIPGFEDAVVGMSRGETKTIVITADMAYGPHLKEMVVDVDRSQFPVYIKPEIGQVLQMRRPDGQSMRVIITGLSESAITIDANHPLAGRDLTFEIEILEIT